MKILNLNGPDLNSMEKDLYIENENPTQMDNILYVGEDIQRVFGGADWVNKRNILALKQVFEGDFYIHDIRRISSFRTFLNAVRGYMFGLNPYQAKKIETIIGKEGITTLFLANSKMGKLARKVKEKYPEIKIIVFFHNIEWQYAHDECIKENTLKNHFFRIVIQKNEADALSYGDYYFVLNIRDALLLNDIYGKKAHLLLPTTFIDVYSEERRNAVKQQVKNEKFNLLFVGINFWGNTEGLDFFIKEVLPNLNDVKLTIVGRDMELRYTNSENIEVHGYVDDLSYYYYVCDLVVLPILSGGGMKTKTAEAMMYKCPILGTTEAFQGYEVDYNQIGGCADIAESMIERLNELKANHQMLEKCAIYSRKIFEDKYSFDYTKKKLNLFCKGRV